MGGECMYEAIIAAVGNVIAGLLNGWASKSKVDNEQLMLQLSEIQYRLDTELGRTNSSFNNLYRNQTLQLFFETLKSLNIHISIGIPNSNVIFDLQSCPLEQDINQALSATAQNVLDFETIKSFSDIIDVVQDTTEEEIEYPSVNVQLQNSLRISTAQIMRESRDRLQQRLKETIL